MAWLFSWTINFFIVNNIANAFILEGFNGGESHTNGVISTSTPTTQHTAEYLTRLHWANSAFDFVQSLNCSEMYFTSQRECNHLLNVRKRNVAVYVAQTASSDDTGTFIATLPDGSLSRAGTHHGVVALDPHPDANFGHLIVLFFIEKARNPSACERHHGTYIGK